MLGGLSFRGMYSREEARLLLRAKSELLLAADVVPEARADREGQAGEPQASKER